MKRWAIALALTIPAWAADYAVLANGARLRAQHIERVDDHYVLQDGAGRIEIPTSQVAALEHEDDPAPPAAPKPVTEPQPAPRNARELVTEAAVRYGLPPAIVHALAATESAYQTNALSPKGAMGVMQLMPSTAKALNADPANVEQNIDAGTRLLRELLEKYANDPNPVRRALAAYNAGPGAVERYSGVPPYRETQDYVEKVIERYWRQVNAESRTTGAQ
jgi:soluble lytic murein transglycosylase-like protein